MVSHDELFHTIAAKVCNKKKGLSAEDCFAQSTNPMCRNHKICRVHEKSIGQLKYVQQSINENTFLRACPGSGKTEVVGLKAAHVIKSWSYMNKGIAVLTFTNNAANEITDRITQFSGVNGMSYPHFVGTIDSWLHGYLANPFAHLFTKFQGLNGDRSLRIIDTGYEAGWLNSYKAPTKYVSEKGSLTSIYANNYYYDAETKIFNILPLGGSQWISHKDLYESKHFRAFKSDKPWLSETKFFNGFFDTKHKFWNAGFCTYQDIEYIVYCILKDPKSNIRKILSKRFPLIIVDECQDLSWIQLKVLEILQKNGSILNFVGDLNQAIYSFKKVFPENINKYIEENDFTKMNLDINYRSSRQIVDLCGKLCHQGSIESKTKSEFSQYSCLLFTYSPEKLSELPQRFQHYLVKKGLDIEKSVILVRGKSMIDKLRKGLVEGEPKKNELPTKSVLLWNTGHWELQKIALQHMGKYIKLVFFPECSMDSRNQYCPDAIKSKIKWRSFIAALLNKSTEIPYLVDHNLCWSNWAKNYKELFPEIIFKMAKKHEIELKSVELKYRSPTGKASIKLSDYMEGVVVVGKKESNIRITTIHQVKGETHDATLLVSSPVKRGNGGYWSEWIDKNSDEHARFAYVASSRPKRILAWAISETNKDGIKNIEELGFKILK